MMETSCVETNWMDGFPKSMAKNGAAPCWQRLHENPTLEEVAGEIFDKLPFHVIATKPQWQVTKKENRFTLRLRSADKTRVGLRQKAELSKIHGMHAGGFTISFGLGLHDCYFVEIMI